jgi:hypothetical protein
MDDSDGGEVSSRFVACNMIALIHSLRTLFNSPQLEYDEGLGDKHEGKAWFMIQKQGSVLTKNDRAKPSRKYDSDDDDDEEAPYHVCSLHTLFLHSILFASVFLAGFFILFFE